MQEIWKDIVDFEGLYQVSNTGYIKALEKKRVLTFGGVRTYKEKLLATRINTSGYGSVTLSKNSKNYNFLAHRIVAQHFIKNDLNKKQVNHKDGDKMNNRVDNLEWVTQKENIRHAWDTGLCEPRKKKVNICK